MPSESDGVASVHSPGAPAPVTVQSGKSGGRQRMWYACVTLPARSAIVTDSSVESFTAAVRRAFPSISGVVPTPGQAEIRTGSDGSQRTT